MLCYAAKSTSDVSGQYRNVDERCPAGSCKIFLNPQLTDSSVGLLLKTDDSNIIGTFDNVSAKYCPLKMAKNHLNFDVIELPKCTVVMNGASLPKSRLKDGKNDEEAADDDSEAQEGKKGTNWILIGCGAVSSLVISVSGLWLMAYCTNRCKNKKHAQKPKPSQKSRRIPAAATSPAIAATSPSVQPTSPTTLPTVSPSAAKTPAKSPAENPKQEVDEKPKIVPVLKPNTPPVTASKAAKTPEAEPYDVSRAMENAPKSLQANGLLKMGGSAVLKEIRRHYSTKPYRQSAIEELEFYLLIVSQAYIEVHGFLKQARQLLCKHGAVFERGKWRSFNETTRRYIAKASTPGYVCWYAFACEYGGEIQISDEVKAEAIFEKLSAPALLTVFFREDLKDQIRRSAYAYMRRHFKKVHDKVPEMTLYSLPYPLCLLPDLKKKDEKAFNESANDITYSTPLEQINQRIKDDTTVEERLTDETQVSCSDGKERLKTLSTEVLGSQTSAPTTVKMD
uniref:RGS domain-containing protein n=1 Tax=Panagrellus redivivus TaxID=6233 RepID=A0A7E5A0A8_PANRE